MKKYTVAELLLFEEQLQNKLRKQEEKIKLMVRRQGEDTLAERFTKEGRVDELIATGEEKKNRKKLNENPKYQAAIKLAEDIRRTLHRIDLLWQKRLQEFLEGELE